MPRYAWLPTLLGLGFVASSIYGVAGPIGQAIGDARLFRRLTLSQGALVLTGVVLVCLFVDRPSAAALVAVYSLAAMVTTASSVPWLRRWLVRMSPREVLREVGASLRSLATLGVATSVGSVYARVDQALVLRFAGAASSAYYGLAARIITQARLVPSSFQLSISALIARRLQTGNGLRGREAELLDRIVTFGSVGVALVVVSLADVAVLALGGADYSDAVSLAVILGVSLVPIMFNYVVATSVVMAGRDGTLARTVGTCAVLNIVANCALIPRYGATSAAVVTVLTELLAVCIMSARLTRASGAINPISLLSALVVVIAGAILKLFLVDSTAVGDVIGSVALIGIALGSLGLAQRSLRALPSAYAPADHR